MKRVLVIEDNDVMREVVGELLRGERFDVQTAPDGLAGVYAAHDHKPDVIVLDLSMPRMGGWDVIEMLRGDDRTAKIPIVVMTALAGDDLRSRAEREGCAGFVVKPFDEADLVALVTRLAT